MSKFVKKIIIILMFFIGLNIVIALNSGCYAASSRVTGISNFPASYQPYLNKIAAEHPNWTFTALNTNLDWNSAINSEYIPMRYKLSF